MSSESGFGSSRLRLSYRDASVEPFAIYPRLILTLELSHNINPGAGNYTVSMTNLEGEARMRASDGSLYLLGSIVIRPSNIMGLGTGVAGIQACISLDHYGISVIERLRKSGDLELLLNMSCIGEVQGQPQNKSSIQFQLSPVRIYKSDWVENILPAMNYKSVMLVEIPKLKTAGFEQVGSNLDSAWKDYSGGSYDNVLTDCRKSLESLKNSLRGYDLITRRNDEELIDWNKISASDRIGEILSDTFKKVWGFTALGPHIGPRAINKEDADFALLTTHALVNFALQRIQARR